MTITVMNAGPATATGIFLNASEAYVERLVVSPDYKRRGIARLLLHAAEDLARETLTGAIKAAKDGVNLLNEAMEPKKP